MSDAARKFLMLGALFAALGVVVGAFGAHLLRGRLMPDILALYQTAVQYQFWHALGLLAVGVMLGRTAGEDGAGWFSLAGWCFVAGTVLFSGSLYALALGAPRALGMVTPLGGVAFIVGWVALALGAARGK